MNYVSLVIRVGLQRVIDGPLHVFAGQRTDRDAGKVTACGLILPSDAEVYATPGVVEYGPLCGDCFPA